MGAAAGLLVNPMISGSHLGSCNSRIGEEGDAASQPWDSEKRFGLDLPFVGFQNVAPCPKVM
jgi:hypothetical protein